MFQDRREAGEQLSQQLYQYKNHPQAIVLALPRGGVPVGYQISLRLGLPLHVFITRKLGAPGNPEFAMGAIAETGAMFINQETIRALSVSNEELQRAIQVERQEITRRQALYRGSHLLPSLTGRVVLLVDDGIATGSTFFASIQAIRDLLPHQLVAAIPVGPPGVLHGLKQQVEKLIVLETPEPFLAVGNHYVDFKQVEDTEVIRYLSLATEALGHDEQAS